MKKNISLTTLILSMAFTALITMVIAFFAYDQMKVLYSQYINPVYVAETAADDEEDTVKFEEHDLKKLIQLQDFIDRYYYQPTDEFDYETNVYKGLFSSLNDPYSIYMDPAEFELFNEESAGSYAGIGVQIEYGKDNLITVVAAFEDTPGDRAGLTTGDKIIKVNGEEVFADAMDAAIKLMKGEPGTDVTLTIKRDTEVFDVTITRDIIVLESVKSRMLEEGIGYLRITGFDEKVSKEFKEHYQKIVDEGAKKLIIDLRDNPGGSLYECVQLADFVLGEQLIVYTDDNHGHREDYKSDENKIDLPFVVLVNGGSASASEVLTGAIKDTNSGTIIGTTTFGKGLVQSVYPLADGSGVKLTTAQYYTLNGTYIHGVGIEPNIVIEQSEDYDRKDDTTDVQLQEAIRVLKTK